MKPKIFIIDDDMTMLGLLCKFLQIEGFEAVAFDKDEDLEAILETARQELPEVILIDVNLKNISGLDVLRLIRNEDQFQNTRLLMSSGMDLKDVCLAEGADVFLQKPYMPEELTERIKVLLSKTE